MTTDCPLCDPARTAGELLLEPLWQQGGWRAWVMTQGPVPGFCLLVGEAHVPTLAELADGPAATLGPALARLGRTIREALGPERIYVYGFGDHVAHLHFGLAPHFGGDELLGSGGVVATAPDPADPRWPTYLQRILEAAPNA